MPRTCSASPTSQPIITERGLARRTSAKTSFRRGIERPQPATMAPRVAEINGELTADAVRSAGDEDDLIGKLHRAFSPP